MYRYQCAKHEPARTGDVAEGTGWTRQGLVATRRAVIAHLAAPPCGGSWAKTVGVCVIIQVERLRVPCRWHTEPTWGRKGSGLLPRAALENAQTIIPRPRLVPWIVGRNRKTCLLFLFLAVLCLNCKSLMGVSPLWCHRGHFFSSIRILHSL